ncbi:MAG: ribonuclease BN, membrane protein [Armatimonadetes bacterium CSP1-3]|nr:MAG: ribonuclease BN, membrane protein [Armatimonadetes bacterium CSP1-3]
MRLSLSRPISLPRIRPLWLMVEAYKKFLQDGAPDLAASIAYSALFSIFPLLLGVVAAAGLIGDEAVVRRAIVETLARIAPPATAEFVDRNVQEAIRLRGTFGILAIVGLFWSATAVASTVRNALNRVLSVIQPRPYLFRKLIDLILVVLAGTFLILSLITSAATLRLISAFPGLASLIVTLETSTLAQLASTVGPVILSTLTFLVIYLYLPNVRIRWTNAIIGALVAGLLFEGIKQAFFWYLQTFARYQLVYGSLTGIIVFLVWMYLSSAILLFGAELASQIGRPYPQEMGTV